MDHSHTALEVSILDRLTRLANALEHIALENGRHQIARLVHLAYQLNWLGTANPKEIPMTTVADLTSAWALVDQALADAKTRIGNGTLPPGALSAADTDAELARIQGLPPQINALGAPGPVGSAPSALPGMTRPR